jgi:hypothetical protein
MNLYRLPAFIVLEIPPPVREAIQSLRDSLATPATRLPVEITVAGSSGTFPSSRRDIRENSPAF